MDGRTFLDSARHLLAAPSEANRRTAAGPIYLAVLHEAQAALARWGFPRPAQEDIRTFVPGCVRTVLNHDALRLADALDQTEHCRDAADYDLAGPGSFADRAEVTRLLSLATVAVDLLDQIEADPARRAAVVAAIQAARP